ncbi:hypothetical protein M885DRAFT_611987, partial [Pelagophyceae sp. CCMP2097]
MAEELNANTITEVTAGALEERCAWLTKALSQKGYKANGKCPKCKKEINWYRGKRRHKDNCVVFSCKDLKLKDPEVHFSKELSVVLMEMDRRAEEGGGDGAFNDSGPPEERMAALGAELRGLGYADGRKCPKCSRTIKISPFKLKGEWCNIQSCIAAKKHSPELRLAAQLNHLLSQSHRGNRDFDEKPVAAPVAPEVETASNIVFSSTELAETDDVAVCLTVRFNGGQCLNPLPPGSPFGRCCSQRCKLAEVDRGAKAEKVLDDAREDALHPGAKPAAKAPSARPTPSLSKFLFDCKKKDDDPDDDEDEVEVDDAATLLENLVGEVRRAIVFAETRTPRMEEARARGDVDKWFESFPSLVQPSESDSEGTRMLSAIKHEAKGVKGFVIKHLPELIPPAAPKPAGPFFEAKAKKTKQKAEAPAPAPKAPAAPVAPRAAAPVAPRAAAPTAPRAAAAPAAPKVTRAGRPEASAPAAAKSGGVSMSNCRYEMRQSTLGNARRHDDAHMDFRPILAHYSFDDCWDFYFAALHAVKCAFDSNFGQMDIQEAGKVFADRLRGADRPRGDDSINEIDVRRELWLFARYKHVKTFNNSVTAVLEPDVAFFAFRVYNLDINWTCTKCKNSNFRKRDACHKCKSSRDDAAKLNKLDPRYFSGWDAQVTQEPEAEAPPGTRRLPPPQAAPPPVQPYSAAPLYGAPLYGSAPLAQRDFASQPRDYARQPDAEDEVLRHVLLQSQLTAHHQPPPNDEEDEMMRQVLAASQASYTQENEQRYASWRAEAPIPGAPREPEAQWQSDDGWPAAPAATEAETWSGYEQAAAPAPAAAPSAPAAPSDGDTLASFLGAIGLAHHLQRFISEEIDSVEILRMLSPEDLADLGLTVGARRKIENALRSV